MENRKSKTFLMHIHKIEWNEVCEVLNITKPTLLSWRSSGEESKNKAIDWAVKEIAEKR